MKYIFTITWFLSMAIVSIAQPTWAPIGAKWHYDRTDWNISTGAVLHEPMYFECTTDTIVAGHACTKITQSSMCCESYMQYANFSGNQTFYLTYSENNKVYFYDFLDQAFHVTFDFNLMQGDTFSVPVNLNFVGGTNLDILNFNVDSTAIININGYDLKRVYVTPTSVFNNPTFFTEVIGLNDFLTFFTPNSICDGTFTNGLRCYEDHTLSHHQVSEVACDSSWIYMGLTELNKSEIKFYPNPSSDVLHVVSSSTILGLTISDFTGRILHTEQPLSSQSNIDVKHLSNGCYFLTTVCDDQTKRMVKFIKE